MPVHDERPSVDDTALGAHQERPYNGDGVDGRPSGGAPTTAIPQVGAPTTANPPT